MSWGSFFKRAWEGLFGLRGTTYVVKSGDTLSAIAKRHYGDGSSAAYMRIFNANRPLLTSPDRIYPGQTLVIPPKE